MFIFGGFRHHILNPESFSLSTAGSSEPLKMTSPPTQPIRQLNRARPPPPRSLQGLSLPYFWGTVKNQLLLFSLSCLFTSEKIDWGIRAVGCVVFRLWRSCKMARGGKRTEGEGEKKKSHLLIILHKWCPFLQASSPCLVVCVGAQIVIGWCLSIFCVWRIHINLSFHLERTLNQFGINWTYKSEKLSFEQIFSLLIPDTSAFNLLCNKDVFARSACKWPVNDSPT